MAFNRRPFVGAEAATYNLVSEGEPSASLSIIHMDFPTSMEAPAAKATDPPVKFKLPKTRVSLPFMVIVPDETVRVAVFVDPEPASTPLTSRLALFPSV